MSESTIRGRPPLPDAKRKAAYIGVRMTAADRRRIERAAKRAGETLSEYLAAAALERARGEQ